MAEKLAKISKTTQIIAVSHLAQIAAMSDNEFLIKKQETNERTETKVMPLNEEGKIRELIRLLGGNDDTTAVRTHAEELLAQARMYKKNLS